MVDKGKLRGVVKDIAHKAIWQRKEFTYSQLRREYRLTRSDVVDVVRDVEELAARMDVVWGYDDNTRTYRVANIQLSYSY